jgi:A/G-specific adenine glycosylase
MSFPLTPKIRRAFHRDLAAWYRIHHRDLPWRRTKDPYAIVVSEFMLQQTQVKTVLPYYDRWLKKFPNWRALAQAQPEAVLKTWEGLGYYTRARNLHRLAQAVVENHHGVLPDDPAVLLTLPGIGRYTAGAIASIAFDRRAAVLDGNVLRVFARVFACSDNISQPAVQKEFWQLAEDLLPPSDCSQHNQALMELGALLCTPRQPQCLLCPLRLVCRADPPEAYPVKTKMIVVEKKETLALLDRSGQWWCEPPPVTGRLAGFWHFPQFDPRSMTAGPEITSFTYGITKYRVRLKACSATWKKSAPAEGKWFTRAEMEKLPFPAAHRRLFSFLT